MDFVRAKAIRDERNIVLVGMPGAGKSTVGRLLAKGLGYGFVDTDRLIERVTGRLLQDIVDREGYMALRKIEEKVVSDLTLERHVIATGGSVVYGFAAMENLKTNGVIVFLDVPLGTLKKRIRNFGERGIAKRPGQTFEALFEERVPLYVRYADFTVDGSTPNPTTVANRVLQVLKGSWEDDSPSTRFSAHGKQTRGGMVPPRLHESVRDER